MGEGHVAVKSLYKEYSVEIDWGKKTARMEKRIKPQLGRLGEQASALG